MTGAAPATPRPVLGGYLLTRRVERPPYVDADLLPARLLSLSGCICDFVPDDWCVPWARTEPEVRLADATRFGVTPAELPHVMEWTAEGLEAGTFGFPRVFFALRDAREFADRFVRAPDLCLIGIALHADLLDDFLDEERPGPNQGVPGIYAALSSRQPLDPHGVELGWEVLCYESGGFHSWLCNGLETEVARELGIRPGPEGLIRSSAEALRAAGYCGREEVGAEPGLWAPWLVVEYPLRGREPVG